MFPRANTNAKGQWTPVSCSLAFLGLPLVLLCYCIPMSLCHRVTVLLFHCVITSLGHSVSACAGGGRDPAAPGGAGWGQGVDGHCPAPPRPSREDSAGSGGTITSSAASRRYAIGS